MATDAELVTQYVDGGRREALAAIYDRHAAAVHDTAVAMTRDRHDAEDLTHDVFLTAAERMGQLRDRTKLRPWLFAILRHAVYARSRGRARTTAVDPTGDDMDVHFTPASPADGPDERLSAEELAADVRAAARGLDERDQLVLELVARQQLSGEDLAEALGVSVSQSYVVVSRMRERVERSLGALVVARTGRRRCAELADLLTGWDGELTVLLRKRVARHVERCGTCEDTRRRTAVLPLVSLAPAAVLPAGLRQRVLADAALVTPAPAPPTPSAAPAGPHRGARRSATRARAVGIAAALAALVAGGAVLASRLGGDPDLVSRGATTTSLGAVSTAPGSAPPATTAPGQPAPPANPPSPPASDPAPTTTAGSGVTVAPPVVGQLVVASSDDEPPRVTLLSTPSTLTCPDLGAWRVRTAVADASPIDAVTLAWRGPGEPGEIAMTRDADGTWSARPTIEPVNGEWVLTADATDTAGNRGADDHTVTVSGCP